MTTIVYDHKNKQVAVDSRCTNGHGEIISDSYSKVFKNDEGLWIFSGDIGEIEIFSKLNHGDEIESKFHISAFLIKDESCYMAAKSGRYMSIAKMLHNDALGSGCQFAIGALDHGKSAKQAVEYAITKDCHSGGKVNVYNLSGEQI